MKAARLAALGCALLPLASPAAPTLQNQAPVKPSRIKNVMPAVPAVDRLFARAAIQGNAAEMQMARVALVRSNAPEVRGYAQKMIDEHAAIDAELRPALTQVLGPSDRAVELAPADALAVAHLRSMSQVDFDQAYALQQIGDHLATASAFRTEADNGTDPRLKPLVRKWLPTIEAHLELAVDLTRHVGGDSPFKSH